MRQTSLLGRLRTVLAGFLLALTCGGLPAASAGPINFACPNNELFGPKLFTDICWDCIFPIRICGGITMNGGSAAGDPPSEAFDGTICSCPDAAGLPRPGCSVGYYEHSQLVDITRNAYCAPSLGGIFLQDEGVELMGGNNRTTDNSQSSSFYNFLYYAFPLNYLLDLVVSASCGSDGFLDFDVMYMSPLDPTWNDDEMAYFLNMEVVVFSNPIAIGACVADAAAQAAGAQPLAKLMWCAGSWGGLYPFTGRASSAASPVRESSLAAAKSLAALHRRGLARRTVGEGAMCGPKIYPTLPKTQYRMSQFFPVAENKGAHYIGEPTFRWGEWRSIPGTGEDYTYVVDRWTDCCLTF